MPPPFVAVQPGLDEEMEYAHPFRLPSSVVSTRPLTSIASCMINVAEGQCQVVLRPATTQQLSEVLRYCNDRKYHILILISIQPGSSLTPLPPLFLWQTCSGASGRQHRFGGWFGADFR
jgi:hypothetical protein